MKTCQGLAAEIFKKTYQILNALEIIKKKRVNVWAIFHSTNAMEYNEKIRQYYDCRPLIQEEYELLKELCYE